MVDLPVIGLARFWRAALQALAVTGAAATMITSVWVGPPGWDGPFPESGAMVRLFSLPPANDGPGAGTSAIPAAVRVTVTALTPPPPGGVTVLRDGFAAGQIADVPAVLMVHTGDVLTLVDGGDRSVRVRVSARGRLLAPKSGPWIVPAQGRIQLPAVVVQASGADR